MTVEIRDEAWAQQVLADAGFYGIYDLVPPEAIACTVQEIATKFQPQRIILFGSYAYGTPKPGSDVDLLVIMDTDNTREQTLELYRTITQNYELDLIVRTPQTVAERVAAGDRFLSEVTSRGKVLYEA